MNYVKKIAIDFNKETRQVLDGQSKICNWLYNKLLEIIENDYKNNNNENNYLSGYNLRNYIQVLKDEHSFLKTVHSTVIKNPAYRLKRAYENYFKDPEQWGHPKFRSWSKKWYSLVYDNPAAGWKVDGYDIDITLGKIIESDGADSQNDNVIMSSQNKHVTGQRSSWMWQTAILLML